MPTLLHRLASWAKEDPHAPAQSFKSDGRWKTITAKEYADRVYHLALFLESRGLDSSSASAILSYNCPQWVHQDLAALLLGARSVGLYPNSTTRDIQHILNHSEAKILGVQNKTYFEKVVGKDGASPLPDRVELILVFDGDTSISPKAVAYEAAIEEGRKLSKQPGAKTLQQFLDALDPHAGVFMIYTSGTTGQPKGALLSQDNFVFAADVVTEYWKLPYARGTMFSFLPLCHVAEKLQNVAVGISCRYHAYFCSQFEQLSKELTEVQPTLLLCVPRVWEKMMEGVMSKIASGKGLKKNLANWALGVGARVGNAKFTGTPVSAVDLAQWKVAEKLVLHKIREALGLSKAEIAASGASPLPAHVAKWFRSLNIEILEDYGQTESTAIITQTEPGVESAGTVGKPLPGTELKIADDGEILSRGRHIFKGYFKNEAATQDTLRDDWLLTGDLGVINEQGQLVIRGRKKEILKTSGGKIVAPLPIEEKIKESPIISQACVVGDNRKYVSVLVTLAESRLSQLREKSGSVSGRVVEDPEVNQEVRSQIDSVNASLASFEKVKRVTVLAKEFSIETGEMTPTLKMKRAVVEKNYQDIIEKMYE